MGFGVWGLGFGVWGLGFGGLHFVEVVLESTGELFGHLEARHTSLRTSPVIRHTLSIQLDDKMLESFTSDPSKHTTCTGSESAHVYTDTNIHRHTDTQTHRHTDTQTHRHTDTQAHRHTDTQAHRHTDTQTHRHTDTQTHRHTDTHTHIRPVAQPVHVGDEQVEQPLKKLGAA